MTTLDLPVTTSKTLIGFDVLSYSDRPPFQGADGNVSVAIRKYFDDGSYEDDSKTLWSGEAVAEVKNEKNVVLVEANERVGRKYSDAGQWTDESAKAKIASLLAE